MINNHDFNGKQNTCDYHFSHCCAVLHLWLAIAEIFFFFLLLCFYDIKKKAVRNMWKTNSETAETSSQIMEFPEMLKTEVLPVLVCAGSGI